MKKQILILFLILFSTSSLACDCQCISNCRFNKISKVQDFVALVKVIEYPDYLDNEIMNYEGKMPYSMIVEIIEIYKGTESNKRIKIWGDNGMLCRPYIANFEVGQYYLIAPSKIEEPLKNESKDDYDFFSCWSDYMWVDYDNKIAYGNYSWWRKKISLKDFEKKLNL